MEVWAQFSGNEEGRRRIDLSFRLEGEWESTFEIEVKGGDDFLRTSGPGDETVTVTGNVATAISVWLKAHTGLIGVRVMVID